MSRLANRKRRETTNSAVALGTTVFNASGIFYPKFGKHVTYVAGRGEPGSSPEPQIVGYNPDEPGTIAGYNPPIPGNYAGSNPSVPGTTNDPYIEGIVVMVKNDPPTSTYTFTNIAPAGALPYSETVGNYYIDVTYTESPVYPGYSNPSTPGTPIYNPEEPGNPNYNPSVIGEAIYGDPIPGAAGTPITTLTVTFPGGAAGQSAPPVNEQQVYIPYTASGIPVTVGAGGQVIVKEVAI